MNRKPLVSVIIPTYNRDTFLEDTILSVSNQTYKNVEILVVDDGSKYNYAEKICRKFDNCNYFYKTNGGLSSARNYGIKKAKGDYIAFLDDDDLWNEAKLEKQVEILKNHKQVDLVHSTAEVIKENGTKTGNIIGCPRKEDLNRTGYVFWRALGKWGVKSPTPLVRKSVFKKDLMFDETIMVGEDVDFYCRFFYRHKIFLINEPLAYYRVYDSDDRLSLKDKEYIGLEYKVLLNLKKMGLRNPLKLYLISYKLLKASLDFILNTNSLNNKFKIGYFNRVFFPQKSLKKIYTHYN